MPENTGAAPRVRQDFASVENPHSGTPAVGQVLTRVMYPHAMAKTTIVQLTDDIDGSEAVEGLTFGLRGVEYEIDLNAKNIAALEKALDKYISAGRKVSRSKASTSGAAPRRARPKADVKQDVGALREWARANGYSISDRGRIPGEVREAFDAAHG